MIRSGSLVPAREAPISLRPQNAPEVGATARHWYNHLWREGGTLVAVATDYFALLPFGHSTSSEDAAHRKISVGRCHILECAIYNARCRRCLWIFDLQPRLRWSRPIYGRELLAHDAFKAELADCFEHFLAVTLGVLDVLNTPARIAKNPFQCILALKKRSAPDVVT